MASNNSYWCYSCSRFVRIRNPSSDTIRCPQCTGGFIEQMNEPPPPPTPVVRRQPTEFLRRRRLPRSEARRYRRTFTNASNAFNPVIVLRRNRPDAAGANNYELYYNEGGRGLHPLPESMSDFLMGSGFERLLEQLSNIETNGLARTSTNPPASKSAIQSMPTVKISSQHIGSDPHCAVCKDPFEIGSQAREMPCKHIYHQDCILPWLSVSNSCPVCRHEMPTDVARRGEVIAEEEGNEEEMEGLTIWRLPGGGFAVGRFTGPARGDRELPVVFTEMDGRFNNGGTGRRVPWRARQTGPGERNGVGGFIRRIFGCFGPSSSNETRSRPVDPERERIETIAREIGIAPPIGERGSRAS